MQKRGVLGKQQLDPIALLTHLPAHSTLQSRVKTYLFSLPSGVVVRDGRVCGLMMVNRAGRQVVMARAVVDATDDARLAAAAGAEFLRRAPRLATVRRFILGELSPAWPPGPLELPKGVGLDGDEVNVHDRGVELVRRIDLGDDAARGLSSALAITLEKAFRLRGHAEGAGKTWNGFSPAPEVLLDETPQVACRRPATAPDANALRLNADALLPAGIDGLVMAGRNCLPAEAGVDLQTLLCAGEASGRAAVDMARKGPALPSLGHGRGGLEKCPPGPAVREILDGMERGIDYPVVRQPAVALPVAGKFDVLVVGGGTSGALAAIAAARQGAKVAVVELLPNLGGTSTNRVNSYYWGVTWKSRLSDEIDRRCQAIPRTDATGLQKVRFSGEDKKLALQDLAHRAGVQVWLRSFAAGAIVQGNKVTGAVVENASGRQVLLADVVIDASGHGDVAAAAGAAFDKGRPSDGFMHEVEYGPLRDSLNVADMSKVYLRMPGKAPSNNLRESRRIVGDYTLTFDDQIHGRPFPDVVCRWRSNYDSHFPHSANEEDLAQDWIAMLGLFRHTINGSIPYRSLLPKGLENILVVGKAYSVTHDALIGARMQRDLQHMGEAAGVAAAMACRAKTTCRGIPIRKLQWELVNLGVLQPEDITAAAGAGRNTGRGDMQPSVRRLGTEGALDAMVDLYLAGPAAAPPVRPLLSSLNPRAREEAALLLGLLNDRSAIPLLVEFLRARNNRTFVAALPRAPGIPSVPLYYSAVILLGRFRSAEAAPLVRELLRDPARCPADLASFAIVALGRIGDRQALDTIRPYLKVACQVNSHRENREADAQWGVRTTAARVLAALGDRSGVPMLIELLEADQSLLRDYALRLLEEITGQRLGKDRRRWEAWWRAATSPAGKETHVSPTRT
jgi:hypothetical protein